MHIAKEVGMIWKPKRAHGKYVESSLTGPTHMWQRTGLATLEGAVVLCAAIVQRGVIMLKVWPAMLIQGFMLKFGEGFGFVPQKQ